MLSPASRAKLAPRIYLSLAVGYAVLGAVGAGLAIYAGRFSGWYVAMVVAWAVSSGCFGYLAYYYWRQRPD